jgi:hypothetical protein
MPRLRRQDQRPKTGTVLGLADLVIALDRICSTLRDGLVGAEAARLVAGSGHPQRHRSPRARAHVPPAGCRSRPGSCGPTTARNMSTRSRSAGPAGTCTYASRTRATNCARCGSTPPTSPAADGVGEAPDDLQHQSLQDRFYLPFASSICDWTSRSISSMSLWTGFSSCASGSSILANALSASRAMEMSQMSRASAFHVLSVSSVTGSCRVQKSSLGGCTPLGHQARAVANAA